MKPDIPCGFDPTLDCGPGFLAWIGVFLIVLVLAAVIGGWIEQRWK